MSTAVRHLLVLAALVAFAPVASASTMGLGLDARESIEAWAAKLGLTVKSVTLAVDHASIDLGDCAILLAHDTGSRCSGLHLDAGGARACLSRDQCLEWSLFQSATYQAGGIYPPWREVTALNDDTLTATVDEASTALVPKDFEAALAAAEEALILMDEPRARRIFKGLLERTDLTVAQLLRFVPALGRLGLGGDALSRLAMGRWIEADMRLTLVVRYALSMGSSVAVAVADALLGERSACTAVAAGRAFVLVGDHAAAASLAHVLRKKDVKCIEAYALEVAAAYRAGNRQASADAFYEARGRFPKDRRLPTMHLTALRATGQWRAAKYLLDQRLEKGTATPEDLVHLLDVLTHASLKTEAEVAWSLRLKAAPNDPVAAFVVGAMTHAKKDYSRSFTLLATAAQGLPGKTGRLHTLQALNALALGNAATASAEWQQALNMAPRDPEGYWAAAEVLRDTDPLLARRYLDIALGLLPHRARQVARMKRQRAALDACDGASACEGPWRYHLGRAQ